MHWFTIRTKAWSQKKTFYWQLLHLSQYWIFPHMKYDATHVDVIHEWRQRYGNGHLEIRKMKIKEANLFNTVGCCIKKKGSIRNISVIQLSNRIYNVTLYTLSDSWITYNITDLVCYTYFHWFFNPECRHIFGKQTRYIFQSPKTIKTWTTKHYTSLNQWYNTE